MRNAPIIVRWALALFVATAAAAVWPGTASAADANLASSTPADQSQVEQLSTAIQLVFDVPIGPSPKVVMTCGSPGVPQTLGKATLLADQVTVSVQLTTPAPKGPCIVGWTVTDTNLQPAGSGNFAFEVTADPVVSTSAAPASSTPVDGSTAPGTPTSTPTSSSVAPVTQPDDSADPATTPSSGSGAPLGLFRLLSYLSLAALFGSFVFLTFAWPEGYEYRVTETFLRVTWLLAVVSAFLVVGATASQQSGAGLGSSLSPTAWGDAFSTMPGKAAVLRFLLVAGSAWVVARPSRLLDPTTQLAALGVPALAVLTLGVARDDYGFVEIAVGMVHALGMSVWFGGVAIQARAVLVGPGNEDLVYAVVGFKRLATPAMLATVLSGAMLMFSLDRGHLGSSHGVVLVLKTLLVAAMVFVSVATRQFVNQRLMRAQVMSAEMAQRLRRAVSIEALVGVAVLMVTSWLLALTPPGLKADAGSSLVLGTPHHFVNNSLNADITVAFSEKVGANDVRIEAIAPTTGITNIRVEFLPPLGSAAVGMAIDPIPLTGAGVAVLEQSKGFALQASGTWTVLVFLDGVPVDQHDVFVND
ncbi:MAG: hypothetical protein RLZ14_2187 [Actinomycetota bacterium]